MSKFGGNGDILAAFNVHDKVDKVRILTKNMNDALAFNDSQIDDQNDQIKELIDELGLIDETFDPQNTTLK